MTNAEKRLRAAQGCIDRFAGKPYEPGKRDCAQMARHCLHLLGRRVGQGKLPHYKSELGGVKALKQLGFNSLIEAVDGFGLKRIPALAALQGDLVALPTEHPLGALAVAVGNGRLLAYLDGEAGAVVIEAKAYECAWRTLERPARRPDPFDLSPEPN